jgi:hypothetical protein
MPYECGPRLFAFDPLTTSHACSLASLNLQHSLHCGEPEPQRNVVDASNRSHPLMPCVVSRPVCVDRNAQLRPLAKNIGCARNVIWSGPSTRFTSAVRFGNPQAKVTVMPSARTQCPLCAGQLVVALDQVLCSIHADFLQCARCGHLWHVPKGEEGPASQTLLGKKLRRAS